MVERKQEPPEDKGPVWRTGHFLVFLETESCPMIAGSCEGLNCMDEGWVAQTSMIS